MPISPMTFTVTDDLEFVPTVAISKMASGMGMLPQLNAALESARERNALEHQPIAIPVLPAPVAAELEVDENEVDDDSDTESTTSSVSSSRFSDVSSAESMTSVSSSSTSSSRKSVSFSTARNVYIPPHRLSVKARHVASPRSTPGSDSKLPHQLPYANSTRPFRRAVNDVDVSRTKASVNRYLYQGGETNVVGGGVMLGRAKKSENSPTSSLSRSFPVPMKKTPKRKTDMVMLGPDVDSNWRRTRNVRA